MMRIVSAVIFLLFTLPGLAQTTDAAKNTRQLLSLQDSLKQLSTTFINNINEAERYNANYAFIKTLVNALKIPRSFNFPFDSLKTISVQHAPDKRFRIFTWHVMNNDGSYRYYGTVQMNNPDGRLTMYPLVDYSAGFKNAADSITTNDKWYGAQYYKIIPVTYNVKTPYYILLGWKGNTPKSTKKVIDVIYFKDNKAYFGMPVFDGDTEAPNKKRIIFEYTRQVSMGLNYDAKGSMIVFDHLAPPDPKLKGNFESYGPDMSYDGYKLLNGRWKLVQDIQLKNPPTEADNNFNDPTKLKGSGPVRRF
jgi:hypothetical protein